MSLKTWIVHGIDFAGPEGDVHIQEANEALPLNGVIEELFQALKTRYVTKPSKRYGKFSDEIGNAPFPQWLNQYRNEQMSFVSMTQKFLAHWRQLLDQQDCQINGHIVFCHESVVEADFLYIFVIQHAAGIYIDNQLTANDCLYIDTQGLDLAVKINLSAVNGDDDACISLLFRRGDKVLTDTFQEAVGFADPLDTVAQTKVFIESVSRYTDTLGSDEVAQETKNRIVDYCVEQDKAGEPVRFEDLSVHVNADSPEAFSQYIEQAPGLDRKQLIPDRKQLRQFVRISGRNENVSLSFTSDCLGESVVFDQENDTLTLRQIPLGVKARLLELLNGK